MAKLFQPVRVGEMQLQHRVIFAPTTRYRADDNHVPREALVPEYYSQRSKVPGTLLITEATFIAQRAGGFNKIPGIWSDEQIAGWKLVTDAVHKNKSFIYLQLWALGRAAIPENLTNEDPSLPYVSASDVPLSTRTVSPRPLTVEEIQEYVSLYATAASNAVHKAGFDGVEIHGANGYLVDQFLQDVTNKRTDDYGGSIENRTRFALQVVDAVTKAVGPTKTGIRMSPWSRFHDMKMGDPKPTFSYLVSKLRELHPDLAYIHAVEPRGDVTLQRLPGEGVDATLPRHYSNDFLRKIWAPKPFIGAGYGWDRNTAMNTAETKGDLAAFCRAFIANPDLPFRLERDIPLVKGDRATYYTHGPEGYIDYPFSAEFQQENAHL
ncbi:FMN-linked oxidoreductase [Mycena floridula]|nr:FMN-linked oxidoreductase [Mycena floridula]